MPSAISRSRSDTAVDAPSSWPRTCVSTRRAAASRSFSALARMERREFSRTRAASNASSAATSASAATNAPSNVTRGARTRSAAGSELGIKGHSAVDVHARAGNVVRIVGSEKYRGLADVFGLADPLVGNEPHQGRVGFRRAPGGGIDGRPDRARRDAVHADAVRGHLLRQAFHHQHNPALGCGVVHMASPGDDLMHGADADDLARCPGDALHDATALELAHGLASAEELPAEVHADDRVPLLERHLLEGCVPLEAGVVDEDVHRAEVLDGALEQILDLPLARPVRALGESAASRLRDLADHLDCGVLPVPIVHHDVGPRGAQREGDGAPDAGACAGDDGFLAVQRSDRGHSRAPLRDPPGYASRVIALRAVTESPAEGRLLDFPGANP